jgi:hypothetical protein
MKAESLSEEGSTCVFQKVGVSPWLRCSLVYCVRIDGYDTCWKTVLKFRRSDSLATEDWREK